VNSSLDLRVERSLGLLGNLKQTAAEFAKKEEVLVRELSGRRYTVTRSAQDATAAKEAAHSANVNQVEEYFRAEAQRIRAIYEARMERVNRYSTTRLRNLPRLAQEAKGKWQGGLQMRNYNAQRKMTADIANADADYAGFSSKLEGHWKTLIALQKQAKSAFRGYWSLLFLMRSRRPHAYTEDSSLTQILQEVTTNLETAERQLFDFQDMGLPKFFRNAPLIVFFLLMLGADGVLYWQLGNNFNLYVGAGIAAAVFGAIWIVHATGLIKAKPLARSIAHALVESRRAIQGSLIAGPAMAAKRELIRKEIESEYEKTRAGIDQQWGLAEDIEKNFEQSQRQKLDAQVPRITAKIDRVLQPKLGHIESQRLGWHERLKNDASALDQQISEKQNAELGGLTGHEQGSWDALVAEWQQRMLPLYNEIDATQSSTVAKFPDWNIALVDVWQPPREFTPITKFGEFTLDLNNPPTALPKDPRLALPGPSRVSLPVALTFPAEGSLLFETRESGNATIIGTVNNIILRLLSTTPPGKLSFTFIDPVGLGQNFAGLMHLADYEESIVNRRIWTQRDQIEERLAETSEHVEKVIQMYLRNEYATITEYNEKAGSVAEKYYFLVVADFPAAFSEVAVKRLYSIAQSGPRCGIFTLVHWDQRQPMPDASMPDELRKSSICLQRAGNDWIVGKQQTEVGATLLLDAPAADELAVDLIHKIGKASIDSNRVQVPFTQVAPTPGEEWTGDTTNELRVAVGRTGATKLQYLAIGKGTRQHALFAGKTGSGKSTLFHVIITNLALTCSPDQVNFYLIDFKKGVEFKCYATKHLPHAKVIAIESDREYALSVLQRVDDELKRRGDMFRKLGVQDVAGYKREGGTEPMPRTILLIDEFQEFFVEDDAVAQGASLLFDRIVRQGRAFGIHVLLGSQSLGGAYTLARTTLGQMAIRVALQCNEADAYLIMDESNAAPRLLSRPGEGIYNDAGGAIEGNSPFQVVWLPDDERDDWLDKVDVLKGQHPEMNYTRPIVFEGNAPSDVGENELLRAALDTAPVKAPIAAHAWLGAPNSIKGPTEAVFLRQSSNNLLIVGQREEASLNMIGLSMLALGAQYPVGTAKFVLFHQATPGSTEADYMDNVVNAMPHEVVVVRGQEVSAAINDLATEQKARSTTETFSAESPTTFLLIHGLQKFKKLRYEDDFSFGGGSGDGGPNPGAQFNELMLEGSGYGIHIITTVDTLSSVNRFINRKALGEFAMRVVFQMSANDSASLIDSPRASNLGLHRALFYHESEGSTETFRPYAAPNADWVRQAAEKLAARRG
jgi:DNA segregation ATPase FtsK/SpoIIIE, S-DNA-T family